MMYITMSETFIKIDSLQHLEIKENPSIRTGTWVLYQGVRVLNAIAQSYRVLSLLNAV